MRELLQRIERKEAIRIARQSRERIEGALRDEVDRDAAVGGECDEASYPGNLGATEMVMFYRKASDAQIAEMERLLAKGDNKAAWKLLQKVTGAKLGRQTARWNPRAAYV